MADERKRFDPDEIFNINGSWLNLIQDHSDQLARLEKRVARFAKDGLTAGQIRDLTEIFEPVFERLGKVEDALNLYPKTVKPRVRCHGVASVPIPPDRDALLATIRHALDKSDVSAAVES